LFEHSTALKVSYRFNDDEGIGKFSKAIIKADEEAIHQFLNEDNQAQVKIISEIDSRIFEKYVLAYADYIHESDIAMALKKLNRFKILCAVREGESGLYSINRKVEKILTSHNLIHITDEFYENRPLIVTQNNYALGLFNGDIGLVRADENGIVKVWFENEKGEIEGFLPALLNKIETVFALTVHKSQGSEFEQVYIVLPQQENAAILSRELLYTAVTRAKKSVILQASIEVILKAVRTKVKRTSGITQRLLLETEY
jgi:exodeoxyribonuclease V alpha subunit